MEAVDSADSVRIVCISPSSWPAGYSRVCTRSSHPCVLNRAFAFCLVPRTRKARSASRWLPGFSTCGFPGPWFPPPMILKITPPTERRPGPYPADRACPTCSAILSRNNPGPECQPCQLAGMPESEQMLDEAA